MATRTPVLTTKIKNLLKPRIAELWADLLNPNPRVKIKHTPLTAGVLVLEELPNNLKGVPRAIEKLSDWNNDREPASECSKEEQDFLKAVGTLFLASRPAPVKKSRTPKKARIRIGSYVRLGKYHEGYTGRILKVYGITEILTTTHRDGKAYKVATGHRDGSAIVVLASACTKARAPKRPASCECDNTHVQNHTCCRACWKAGFCAAPR